MKQDIYVFKPIEVSDLPLLRKWLEEPEVKRWWGNPDEELALLEKDLEDPRMDMRLVLFEGQAFGYIQDYDVHAWPQKHLAHLPPGSRAIDVLIGAANMLGKGHGSAFLRVRARQICSHGVPELAIDPDVRNLRARRAYEKAGFIEEKQVELDDGVFVLMMFEADTEPKNSKPEIYIQPG